MKELVVIISGLVIVVFVWVIIYFAVRIAEHHHIKKHLGDMPSADEISKLYEQNNSIIRYENISPTDKNSSSSKIQ